MNWLLLVVGTLMANVSLLFATFQQKKKPIKAIYNQIVFITIGKETTEMGLIQNLWIEKCDIIKLSNLTFFRLSMSAVCTNGQIKAGGIYYMISRALGDTLFNLKFNIVTLFQFWRSF